MTLYSQQTDPDSHEGGQENAEYVEYFADPLPRISATTGHFQSTQFSQPLQDSLISLTSRSHHHSHQKRDRSSHPIHIPNFAIYPSFGMDCHPDLASPTESYCRQAPEVGSNAVDRNFLLSNRHPTNQTIPLQPISSYWTIPDCSIDNSFADLHSQEMNTTERGIAGFVSKLYQSLQAPDEGQKYAHWCNHNGVDMFIIECIPKFTENVLPKLFKHCKFASFVRQLNVTRDNHLSCLIQINLF
ncbi:hypothetical protein CLU79DRAFT_63212 [Phycomyces nitens]|nr:hypothetical protein CLU79DRAFT_63212 [Phycomyces nitens]